MSENNQAIRNYRQKIDNLAQDLQELKEEDEHEYDFMRLTIEEMNFDEIEMSFRNISAMIGSDSDVVDDYTKAMYLLMQIEDAFEQVENNSFYKISELKGGD